MLTAEHRRPCLSPVSAPGPGSRSPRAAVAAGHTVVGTVRTEAAASQIETLGDPARAEIVDVSTMPRLRRPLSAPSRRWDRSTSWSPTRAYGHEGTMEESTDWMSRAASSMSRVWRRCARSRPYCRACAIGGRG